MAHLKVKAQLAQQRRQREGDYWLALGILGRGSVVPNDRPRSEADTLADRIESAARFVVRDSHWSDRAEVEASLLAATVERVSVGEIPARRTGRIASCATPYRRACRAAGVIPGDGARLAEHERPARRVIHNRPLEVRANDPRVSFTALVNLGRDAMRPILKRREREALESAEQREERSAERRANLAATIEQDLQSQQEQREASPEAALLAADRIAHAMRVAPDSIVDGNRYPNVWRYLYSAARNAESDALAAAEIGASYTALRQSIGRARKIIRERYPTAAELLAGMMDATALDLDESATAGTRRNHSVGWSQREPRTKPDSEAPVVAKRLRGGRRKHRPLSDQQRAEALARRARASRSARRSTLPTKGLRTKSGHAGETGVRG